MKTVLRTPAPETTHPVKKLPVNWKLSNHMRQALFLILILAVGSWGIYKIGRVFLLVENISADARDLSTVTENGSFAEWQSAPDVLTARLHSLKANLSDLHAEVGPFAYIGLLLGWVPRYGGEAAQAPALLEFADSAAEGAYTTLVLFESVSSEVDAGRLQGKSVGVSALSALQNHAAEIEGARQDLARARAARAALDVTRFGGSTRSLIDRLDRLFPLWSTAVNGFALAPNLLGANSPQEFLLIIQNSDELRATGGLISSVVDIRMDHGDIAQLDYRDSYALDNPNVSLPTAPGPLQKYMDAKHLVFRDTNWSPDFPTTARNILTSYELSQGSTPVGVIATNLNMLAGLLQTLGPINVEGTSEQVSGSNAMSIIQSYYDSPEGQGHSADWWYHRKDFAGKLLVSALENLRNGQFDKTQFVHLLAQAFESKELLLFLNDPGAQEAVYSAGWSGGLRTGSGDMLMIVDSNLGFNKVDPNIHRNANYAVELDSAGNGTARLTLNYTNTNRDDNAGCIHAPYYPPSYAEQQQGCYWDYLRILSAPGAQLLNAPPDADAGTDDPLLGRSSFHGYFVLPRGATKQLQYYFQIPRVLADGRTYQLHIQKQPGAPPWAIHVQVTLPVTGGVESIPSPQLVNGRTLEYDLTLDHDLDIVIVQPAPLLSNLSLSLGSAVLSIAVVGFWWFRRRSSSPGTRTRSAKLT
jgi:hypothetical protein